jgi:hypothetical protein
MFQYDPLLTYENEDDIRRLLSSDPVAMEREISIFRLIVGLGQSGGMDDLAELRSLELSRDQQTSRIVNGEVG